MTISLNCLWTVVKTMSAVQIAEGVGSADDGTQGPYRVLGHF